MTVTEMLAKFGLDPAILIAGTAGGLLRGLSRQRFKVREVILSPICGALAAGYLTPVAIHIARHYQFPPLPDDPDTAARYATAFVIGTMAMWLSDLVFAAAWRWIKTKAPTD